MKSTKCKTATKVFAQGVGRALRRPARPRAYNTPIDVWENGKVAAKRP